MTRFIGFVIGWVLLLAGSALHAEEGPAHISELNLGKHWYGAKIDKEDLVGKVVLVEIWGS
ncbi:MAG: hypothetical protein ACYTHM_08250 [Planctomycetota bacterium]|jgi:hypothetical protein